MKDAENICVDGRNLQIRYSNIKGSQMKGGNNSAKKGPASEFGVFDLMTRLNILNLNS